MEQRRGSKKEGERGTKTVKREFVNLIRPETPESGARNRETGKG
jgi:hypothetical protein